MSAPLGASTEGKGTRNSTDAAMANPVTLPISDAPFSIDISTPTGSDKSRSLRDRRHLPPLVNAVVPSHAGTHRGYVPLSVGMRCVDGGFDFVSGGDPKASLRTW